jgi:hypothetical protein
MLSKSTYRKNVLKIGDYFNLLLKHVEQINIFGKYVEYFEIRQHIITFLSRSCVPFLSVVCNYAGI